MASSGRIHFIGGVVVVASNDLIGNFIHVCIWDERLDFKDTFQLCDSI